MPNHNPVELDNALQSFCQRHSGIKYSFDPFVESYSFLVSLRGTKPNSDLQWKYYASQDLLFDLYYRVCSLDLEHFISMLYNMISTEWVNILNLNTNAIYIPIEKITKDNNDEQDNDNEDDACPYCSRESNRYILDKIENNLNITYCPVCGRKVQNE